MRADSAGSGMNQDLPGEWRLSHPITAASPYQAGTRSRIPSGHLKPQRVLKPIYATYVFSYTYILTMNFNLYIRPFHG